MTIKQLSVLCGCAGLLTAFGFWVTLKVSASDSSAVPYQGQAPNRFMMFYSPRERANTFLVNTQAGQVWQLSAASNGNTVFQKLVVSPTPSASPAASRYVIYFSPHDEADTFLLDTFTGREWQEIENDTTHAKFFGEVSVRGISQRPASY